MNITLQPELDDKLVTPALPRVPHPRHGKSGLTASDGEY
jgi:hypothetical protein